MLGTPALFPPGEMDVTIITGQETDDEFRAVLTRWLEYQITTEEEHRQTAALLDTLARAEAADLVGIFIETMQATTLPNPADTTITTQRPYTSKLMTYRLSRDALAIVAQVVDLDFYTLMYSVADILDEALMAHVVANVTVLFPDPEVIDLDALVGLLVRAIEADNFALTAYLDTLIAMLEKGVAPIPDWIIPGWRSSAELLNSLRAPVLLSTWDGMLTDDIEYCLAIAQQEDPSIDLEDLRAQMHRQMSSLDEERRDVMRSMRNNDTLINLMWDQETFRVLGACLQVPNSVTLAATSDDPCQCHGGCRVMLCYQHENWDPTTEDVIFQEPTEEAGALAALEWFSGECQNCYRIILKKCYGVRMPIESGGWRGCYCSFACLRQQTEPTHDVRHRMLNFTEELYARFGVYDRD